MLELNPPSMALDRIAIRHQNKKLQAAFRTSHHSAESVGSSAWLGSSAVSGREIQ
jgi:hypothetical protein